MGCGSSKNDVSELQEKNFLTKVNLGNTGINVSSIGLGCMGLSAFYTDQEISEEDCTKLLQEALDQGLNFLDTAWIYGTNEILIGKVLKKLGREKFIIATKFPMATIGEGGQMTPIEYNQENVDKYCQESLDRLQIDSIDLYYYHRVYPGIPIETQVSFFKPLLDSGKIKHYGLSEASEDTIRRAHKVHPVTAVQEEYSLFSRHVESNGVLKTCEELGISLVAYSPLGRGVLTSSGPELSKNDYRGEANGQNKFNSKNNTQLIDKLKEFAQNKGFTPSQIALAWLLTHKSVIPIPGTKRSKYLIQNNQSALAKLTNDEVKMLDEMFPPEKIDGERYPEAFKAMCSTTTPPLEQ